MELLNSCGGSGQQGWREAFTDVKSAPTKACSTPRNIVIGMMKSWLGSFSSFIVMASNWNPDSPNPLPSRFPSLYLRNYKEANSTHYTRVQETRESTKFQCETYHRLCYI